MVVSNQQTPRRKLNPERANFAAMLNQQRMQAMGLQPPPTPPQTPKTATAEDPTPWVTPVPTPGLAAVASPDAASVPLEDRVRRFNQRNTVGSPALGRKLEDMLRQRQSTKPPPPPPPPEKAAVGSSPNLGRQMQQRRPLMDQDIGRQRQQQPQASAQPPPHVSPEDAPVLDRFRRMLRMGVPAGAVRNQMEAEGYGRIQEAVFLAQPVETSPKGIPGPPSSDVSAVNQRYIDIPKKHRKVSKVQTYSSEAIDHDGRRDESGPLSSQKGANSPQRPQVDQASDHQVSPIQDGEPSPQHFLSAAVLANALQSDKRFQKKQKQLRAPEELLPIQTLEVIRSNHRHTDHDNGSMNDDATDDGSLSTLGSLEAGPKSKEWRQAQFEHAKRIMNVYQTTQNTAHTIDTDPTLQLPKTQYPATLELSETRERHQRSASMLMDKMTEESDLFHKQITQLENPQPRPDPAVERRKQLKELTDAAKEPRRLVHLRPVVQPKPKTVPNATEIHSHEHTSRSIDEAERLAPMRLNIAELPTETPQTIFAGAADVSLTAQHQASPSEGDNNSSSGGTMHLSDYNRRRYLQICLLLAVFILLPLIIGLSVASSNAQKRRHEDEWPQPSLSPSLRPNAPSSSTPPSTSTPSVADAPSGRPTPTIQMEVLDILVNQSLDGGLNLQTPDTPQNAAFEWLVSDLLATGSNYSHSKLLERYALATLYYSTNGRNGDGNSWLNGGGWLSENDACTWYGAQCKDEGTEASVTSLELSSNRLIGSLPDELYMIRRLENLSLNENGLLSKLPSGLGFLTFLKVLDLSSNSLTGPLLTQIGGLVDLTTLQLQSNGLSGTIPTELQRLTLLQLIRLDSNNFYGDVPDDVCYSFSTSQPRFYSDCGGSSPDILCPAYPCCTFCCDEGNCECVYANTAFDYLC